MQYIDMHLYLFLLFSIFCDKHTLFLVKHENEIIFLLLQFLRVYVENCVSLFSLNLGSTPVLL